MRLNRILGARGREREPAHTDAAATALSRAEDLVRSGRAADAVDLLAGAYRDRPDPVLAIETMRVREQAAYDAAKAEGRRPWPPAYDDPFPGVVGQLPEIDLSDLRGELMGAAIAHHGALVVRNILEPQEVRQLLEGIGRANARRERGGTDPDDRCWYRPYPLPAGAKERVMIERRGGIWMGDSPANTAFVLDVFRRRGVLAAIAEHLGERPCFSLQKSTLRRTDPVFRMTGWHQDGAFLGPNVRTINVWTALTPCGGDRPTPGLELVPTRLPEILSTEGGIVVSSVAPELLAQVKAVTPPVRPEFEPGDGVVFDERFLHSTYLREGMTEARYALECWFFAPSHRSPDYVPFLA